MFYKKICKLFTNIRFLSLVWLTIFTLFLASTFPYYANNSKEAITTQFQANTFNAIPSFEVIPFSRPNVVTFHIQSTILNQPMLVEIMLPFSYGQDDVTTYPVMYTTDSLINFPLIASNNYLQSLSFEPPLPEVITVGVDFIEIDEVREFKRLDYYTPVQDNDENVGLVGGKADLYIDFIKYELKPFINALFKTDQEQEIFGGHSMGGLLSLYILFTQEDLFDEYIAASPSIYWADEIIFNYEAAYFHSYPTSHKNLFISVGTAEDPYGITLDYVTRMARKINKRHYPNLGIKFKKYKNENHLSVIAPAFAQGMRFVFTEDVK